MANGDDLKIGGLKDLSLSTLGLTGSDIGSDAKITVPQYNTFTANKLSNDTQFLSMTKQSTRTGFDSRSFDYKFGTSPGINSNQQFTPEQKFWIV